ncbi:hypothetical protein RJT34_26131 [Clitoria ternatea]|uniref:Uncharacterized protein n=1 Tax=Clitoria ternatea TaxID=43366 RepID=A0AAN9F8V1_CLITE
MTQTTPSDLKVVQVCFVAPLDCTNNIASTIPTSLPLTFFDLLWLRFPPVERLFFYEFPHSSSSSFFDSLLPNLKHSLSLTLQHFLPFAGNITWPLDSPKPIINYVPGDAVSFIVAQSNADFNYLCSDLCEASQRHPLIPHLTTSDEKASLFALQVTLFPNTGFCIGITTHHAAFDGKSSTLFMKAWAYYACHLGVGESQAVAVTQGIHLFDVLSLPQHLTPSFDRSVIRDPSGIGEAYLEAWMEHDGGPNNRSLKVWDAMSYKIEKDALKGLFELSPLNIQKLKQYAHSKLKTMKVINISAFSVISAYVLACLVKAEQPEGNCVLFIFPVECRTRLLDTPIPTYFGNCVTGKKVWVETKKLMGNDGFISALEGISEGLNRVKEGLLEGAETSVSDILKSKKVEGTKVRVFSTAGSPWFEVYSTDFGCGRPKKVDMTSIDRTGAFSLSETRNNSNGGIEIGLVLGKHEMEAFSTHFLQGLESF